MTIKMKDLQASLEAVRLNPTLMQRTVIQHLRDATEGKVDIVDVSNPVSFTLESAVVAVSTFMSQNEINTRKQYPAAAQDQEDLYLHMSDKDYPGRFALPAPNTKFSIVLRKEEILNKMVVDPATGYKKLTIPRNAYIEVAGNRFNFEYPVEIRVPAHGNLQVVRDTDIQSPLQELETNAVDWYPVNQNGLEYIRIDLGLPQFAVKTQNETIRTGRAFVMNIPYEDQYYHARVYMSDANDKWQEIQTTHTAQVYDYAKWTAVLRVTDGNLRVSIPQIYTNLVQEARKIRVDVYTTKGEMSLNLANYPDTSYSMEWTPLDKRDETVFVAPLTNLETLYIFSNDIVVGGRSQLPFEEFRDRVIMNSVGPSSVPISNARIEAALIDKGYDIVKNIDNITNRVYLATKQLPLPTNDALITAASTSVQVGIFTMDDIKDLGTVADNGTSLTIKPTTLFMNNDGKLKLMPKSHTDQLMALPPENRALAVTSNNYYWTPWHYVLDLTKTEFEARPYYLNNPQITSKRFDSQNDTTLLDVSVDNYEILMDENGYKIRILTRSSDAWRALSDSECHVQLAFVPVGEVERCYQNGVQVMKDPNTGERVYEFDLTTNWNVTSQNGLELTKFKMFIDEARIFGVPLKGELDVLFSTSRAMDVQWRPAEVDELLGRFILPSQIAGITHETLRVTFGKHLKNLWARARSIISEQTYERWAVDVPAYWEEDDYEVFADGTTIKVENGQIVQNKLHSKGDPKLDPQGRPIYVARAGQVKLDAYGKPILVNPRGMYRQVDFMLVEGAYYFATDSVAVSYRQEMTDILVKWITDDIPSITPNLLEQTRIYFYPKATTGLVDVMVGQGITTSIQAGQAFRIDMHLSSDVYRNKELQTQLQRKAVQTTSTSIGGAVIAMSAVTDALRDSLGDDIIDVRITGLGGDFNYPALTILDDSARCSIRKKLTAQPDGFLIVQEDIAFNMIRHSMDR